MSYHRGGKVWVEENGLGWVALEKDWAGDLLPQDLVSENGLVGVDFHLADYRKRASLGGYAKFQNKWFFFFSDRSIEFHNLHGKTVFLMGDFNNWERLPEYKLTETEDGWGIWLSEETLEDFEECEFKFLADDGRWIEPHQHFPASSACDSTSRNAWFHQLRTGRDLFSFRAIDSVGAHGAEKWIKSRPSGEFGFFYDGNYSNFRIYAPRAELVELLLFETHTKDCPQTYSMIPSEDGTWSFSCSGNLIGKYYQFFVSKHDRQGELFGQEIIDPYARATVGRNGPGIALNRKSFARGDRFVPPAIEDTVVVEAHLRDILAHATMDLVDSERLEFAGLTKWLQSEDCYLRKLGANVVELQPVQEFDAKKKQEYHWGYMPVNFFAPASVYGTSGEDGRVIPEFAQLVDAFHKSGLSVVLDVVYNHIGIPPHLIHLDPEIYCLTDQDGKLTNFSGCGNDLRCDSQPVKKIIIDSLVYWVEVFDVDGFRFDLGELLGFELLSEIESELKKIKPGILLFAEPWSFRGRLPPEMNQTSYGLWSDACREELLNYAKNQSGKDLVIELLSHGLDRNNVRPCQSVNYLESHDDYALVDRFRDLTVWQDQEVIPDEVVGRIMLAMGLLMVAPGVPMISAGQDFLRHKKGIRNTYLLGEVNALDYEREGTFPNEASFIRELINLRLGEPGRRARQSDSGEWVVHTFCCMHQGAIAFGWESVKTEEKFLITTNSSLSRVSIELPQPWKENTRLLVGYNANESEPSTLSPLSFSWFMIG